MFEIPFGKFIHDIDNIIDDKTRAFQAYLGTDDGANKHRNRSSSWQGMPTPHNPPQRWIVSLPEFSIKTLL